RLVSLDAMGSRRSRLPQAVKEPMTFNCTAEIILKYPIPAPTTTKPDADADGIPDSEDSCVFLYGYPELNGCPNKNAIIIPFEPGQSSLYMNTYKVMDSIIRILRKDNSILISIEGHAYKTEGVESLCERLAMERAVIVRRYLSSRLIDPERIKELKNMGKKRPLNAGKNPWEIARNSRAEIYFYTQ
ncbi:MAG: OmpA family protein, partial [Ferruginibacter sp.]